MRGSINEIPEAGLRYDYYDISEADSDYEYLNDLGFQGGGYTWSGIVYGMLKLKDPGLLSRIEMDPEGEGLAVWSDSRQVLEKVAAYVAMVKQDKNLMQAAIQAAEEDGEME